MQLRWKKVLKLALLNNLFSDNLTDVLFERSSKFQSKYDSS